MIVILKQGISREKVQEVCAWLETQSVKTSPIFGEGTVIIGLVGDTSSIDISSVEMHEGVERVMKVSEPYKRANRKFHPDDSIIDVGGCKFGGKRILVIAGPCSVESEEQIVALAEQVKASGATALRGGAFKPRTSPYAFQGLRAEGLMYLKKAREKTGLPICSEITNLTYLDMFNEYVDIIQVGARNMQNFEMLKELGRTGKTILLKRGFANTLEELLMASEYIMSGGNEKVILCERGIRTFETSTRNTLDISAVPMLKKLSHLPVVVDPSHASGLAWMVEPLSKAAVAVGVDGLEIEVHNDPEQALSDGQQSLTPEAFDRLMKNLKPIAAAIGREI